ncbi:MAG TPA: DUF4350 domain-containing protein [Pyrinomonadaceae bacterium]|jgi:hypothetical protein|nr:DUF4350 domain-containing protein [Pyrinomonadaceae bacterium]
MRQRITIILTFVVIIGLLVILNSITYVQKEKTEDTEIVPNRSTYHSGPTGTRALHDFLNEAGYKVMRWRESPERLFSESGKQINTFVVIGRTQVEFTGNEAEALRDWVGRGGRLVLIDRDVNEAIAPKSEGWSVKARQWDYPTINDNPGDTQEMTKGVKALHPVQATVLTSAIDTVMPSRFAGRLSILPPVKADNTDKETSIDVFSDPEEHRIALKAASSAAPIVHIGNREGALLIDYAYGMGRIVMLSDPYIVTNSGIKLNDNLQLAINTLAGGGGLIAFDEYHQGKAISQNPWAGYFAGTPVLALGAQIALLILLILWTSACRFGRPLPLPHTDRRSTLEFVASMAELQERSRAYDLAIENIYTRTRRVLARYAGMDYNSSRAEIAKRIAERSTIDARKLETLMRQCEEAINGEAINWRQSLDLVRRLREVEKNLGLRMRAREERQAAENI